MGMNCWLRLWLLMDVLEQIVKEIELFKEVYVRDCFPVDWWTRRDELCGGSIVILDCI